jgi:hypothetical protein
MDIRAKERGDGGRTVPPTIRMTAVMFLDADDVIAKKWFFRRFRAVWSDDHQPSIFEGYTEPILLM